jgi:energy-converting hydrogenase Eha subunit C
MCVAQNGECGDDDKIRHDLTNLEALLILSEQSLAVVGATFALQKLLRVPVIEAGFILLLQLCAFFDGAVHCCFPPLKE